MIPQYTSFLPIVSPVAKIMTDLREGFQDPRNFNKPLTRKRGDDEPPRSVACGRFQITMSTRKPTGDPESNLDSLNGAPRIARKSLDEISSRAVWLMKVTITGLDVCTIRYSDVGKTMHRALWRLSYVCRCMTNQIMQYSWTTFRSVRKKEKISPTQKKYARHARREFERGFRSTARDV